MIRKHEIWTTPDGRIVYRIRNAETGERISLTDRSAGEYLLTIEQMAREITQDLEVFIIPRPWNGQPRVTPELRTDFELIPHDDGESEERIRPYIVPEERSEDDRPNR